MAWIYLPQTCWKPSPGSGCLARVHDSPPNRSASEPSLYVSLSGKHAPRRASWRGWRTRLWSRRLSGTTLPPLTAALGAAQWIGSLEARRASPIPAPASDGAMTTNEAGAKVMDRSRTSPGSSPSVDPPWSSSRMFHSGSQTGLFSDSASNYQAWVTRSRTRCSSLRATLARLTSGSGYSSWPSPDSQAMNYGEPAESHIKRLAKLKDKHRNGNGAGTTLAMASQRWASPAERYHKGANSEAHRQSRERPHEDQLPNQSAIWSRPDETTTDDGLNSLLQVWTPPVCPRLSPAFQWWLMRWPHPAAIYCASEATAWTRWWQRLRLEYYGINTALNTLKETAA